MTKAGLLFNKSSTDRAYGTGSSWNVGACPCFHKTSCIVTKLTGSPPFCSTLNLISPSHIWVTNFSKIFSNIYHQSQAAYLKIVFLAGLSSKAYRAVARQWQRNSRYKEDWSCLCGTCRDVKSRTSLDFSYSVKWKTWFVSFVELLRLWLLSLRHGDSSVIQRKVNVYSWNPLPEHMRRHGGLRRIKYVVYWTVKCV